MTRAAPLPNGGAALVHALGAARRVDAQTSRITAVASRAPRPVTNPCCERQTLVRLSIAGRSGHNRAMGRPPQLAVLDHLDTRQDCHRLEGIATVEVDRIDLNIYNAPRPYACGVLKPTNIGLLHISFKVFLRVSLDPEVVRAT